MLDPVTDYFNSNYIEYDQWFETHRKEYDEQLSFLKDILPKGKGIEIGVGTGRFAGPLKIQYGLDSSKEMLKLAEKRGVKTILGSAYSTDLPNKSFEYSLFYMTLCFLSDPVMAVREASRISKKVISVILDRNSEYVQRLMNERRGFYAFANFYTAGEIIHFYLESGLKVTEKIERDLTTSEGVPYKLVAIIG
ncbi:MAG: class I SAM-dependent methyltransferase [Thermoplasmatales archaeon]